MAKIDPMLKAAIHNTVGMMDFEIEQNPAEYVRRFVSAGLAVIDLREKLKKPKETRP